MGAIIAYRFEENFDGAMISGFADGGGKRDRTADPLLAKQMLSQLSYTPTTGLNVVELRGIEPRTSCMPCKRSPN